MNAALVIDRPNRSIRGATLRQRMGVAAMQAAYKALKPVRHKGLGHVNSLLGKLALGHQDATFRIDADTVFRAPADDHYWGFLYNFDYQYEVETGEALSALRNLDYAFLDLGANYGYWSVIAASARMGRKPVVAVEASSASYEVLRRNLQGSAAATEHAGIWSRDGDEIALSTGRHEARGLATSGSGLSASSETVRTVTIDTLVDRHAGVVGDRPLFVKLDVEGAEMAAIAGAARSLDRIGVLSFEELNDDSFGKTFAAIQAMNRFSLVYHDKAQGRFHRTASPLPVFDPSKASRFRPKFGHNFFAVAPDSVFEAALLDYRGTP